MAAKNAGKEVIAFAEETFKSSVTKIFSEEKNE